MGDDLRQRARRRWLVMMGVILVVVTLGVPVLDSLLGIDGGSRHHRHGTWAVVVPVVSALLVSGALMFWLARRSRRDTGMFAPQLINGLTRSERRRAGRAIKLARPSSDETLARVERDTARRTLDQSGPSRVIFSLVLVLTAVEAATESHPAARIYFGAGTLLMVVMLVLQVRQVSRSRRYLEAAGLGSPPGGD